MNIESANLSSVSPNNSTVESLPLLADGSVVSEGFSGALVAQIELLNNIKTENESTLQTPDVGGLSVGNVEMQDFAALLGNDLPPAYKIKDEVDHEAALAAVTDSLKYISKDTDTAAGEAAVEAEQRMNDVIAMTVPVEQGISDAGAVPVEQSINDAVAATVSVEQNMKNGVALAAPVEQNTTAAVVETAQPVNDAVVTEAQVQAGVEHGNDRPDKQQAESEAQVAVVEDNRGAEELLASIILPVVMPTEREKAVTVNNLASADVTEESLTSFIKPSTADAKPNQFAKVAGDVLQSEAVFRQPVQNKQDFNLKYLEDAGQAEKTGRVEQPVSSLEGEKSLSRVDLAQVSKPIVDNKTDVPAITKPLSHPEWNKDLGERIVWMSSKAIPSAEIRLNPQHLGPISVRVNVTDDQATVVFTAQHAATREAIEASVPKLREMMGAQQLNLAEVNVSQSPTPDQGRSQSQSFAQNFADDRGQGSAGTVVEGADVVEQDIESGQAVVSKGLLSLYA
ncbi:MAG: flagellar hook-length control protein FliK [Methylobacter sp.]